ncbi:hypothetical protein CEV32_1847 [Brucella rhizosphaerae]|uniref:Uncharacterized protein n=1 Tax=Brucella rhizosphaerae TaxID=571254 RepID=A0A256F3J0_9HYPH|nr:hypothetical protein CEV32_1847 [Brucella rhizosphaerae]
MLKCVRRRGFVQALIKAEYSLLYLFVFTHYPMQNRFALLLEML